VNTGSKRGVGVERESQKDRMKEGRNKICRERERERMKAIMRECEK